MTTHNQRKTGRRLVGALLCATSLSGVAFAAHGETVEASAPNVVGEVIVTARRRQESLQKVPVAVAVVNGAEASAQNLNDIQDISASVPSVDFRTSASNKDRTIFIRGVGTISTSPGVEPSVSTVVDGVVLIRAGQATIDLLDVDHVEVLEGPQGTLFGKNATAGVVNIVTKSPTDHLAGYIDGGVYEGGEYRLGAGVSGPILGDKLLGLLSAYTGQYNGNVRNLYNGRDVNGYRDWGLRGKFVAHALDNLTLTLSADYTHSADSVPTGVFTNTSNIAYQTGAVTSHAALASSLAQSGVTPSPDNTTISSDDPSSVHDKNGGVSLQIDWDIGSGYRVTSISAYRDWRNVQYQDYDQLSSPAAPGLPVVADTGYLHFNQESEELRIASPKGKVVDFVAGVYLLRSVDHETYQRAETSIIGGAPTNNFGVNHYGANDNNYAVFGEADFRITSRFRLIGGLRGVRDELSYYASRVSTSPVAITGIGVSYTAPTPPAPTLADPNPVTYPTGVSHDDLSGRAGLQYDLSNDVTTYFTYSHGYLGPAFNVFFNMAYPNTAPLVPETSNSYELGLKAQLFDHRLQANLAAFITDFSNYQANFTQSIAGGLVTNLINAGSVTSRGGSADFVAKPYQGVTLDWNLAYDDAHVVSFPCPAGSAVNCNINGQPLPFSPKFKMHIEGDYRRALVGPLDVDLETDYNYQSDTQYQLSETPQTIQPAYGIWNASIGLLDDHAGLSARFLVKNIVNQHYSSYLVSGDLGGIVRYVPRDNSRYVGFNVRKDF
jgi:iron complex outermembrane receptor protein